MSARSQEWRDRSLCGLQFGGNPEWWHSDSDAEQAEATRWCTKCPVRKACLAAVMAEEEGKPRGMRFGIRAGLTGLQRYRIAAGKPAGAP